MIVKCKKCGTEYDCDETYRGKSFRCNCGQEISVASFSARPPVARQASAQQNVTVVVNQSNQRESNPCGTFGLLCVLASIPLAVVLPPLGVVAGVVGFLCCLIGLFFRPRGAAGCGLLICVFPYMILAGIIGALAPSADDIREKIKENEKSAEVEAEEDVAEEKKELSRSDFIDICRWQYTWPRHVCLLADKKGVTLFGGGKADIAKGVNFRLEDVFRDGRLKLKLGEAEKFFVVDYKETNFSEVYEMPPKS